MKLKVALCISGHMRSFEETFSSLQNSIINKYSPDIFIHSWDREGYDGANGRGDARLINVQTDISKIKKLYNSKNILIEKMPTWNTNKYTKNMCDGVRNPQIVLGMFYSIFKVNELKSKHEIQNNFTYDFVIRARADLLYENELIIENQKGIYFPTFGAYAGVADQFAYGSSENMDIYSEMYNNLDKNFDAGIKWQPESQLKYHIENNKVAILPANINYCILRANGQKFYLAK